jgi:hypothetical protein
VGRQFGAILATDGESPHRITAEIEPDDDVLSHGVLLGKMKEKE